MNHRLRNTKRTAIPARLSETARALDRSMARAGIPSADKEAFLDWAVGSLWKTFKDERMNQRLIIENEIRLLGLRFPNGTVHKPYSVEFSLPADKISDITLEGAGEIGLHLFTEPSGKCILSGNPVKSGDFTLRLRFRTVPGEPASEIAIPVAFNPDPRSLWRNIPTNTTIDYFKPDSAAEYVRVASDDGIPRKNMVAASQRGRSHARDGKPRDDHFTMCHCDRSDWYILAVADGAGSAPFSRKGSETACETAVSHCREMLLDNPEFEQALRAYAVDRDNIEKRTEVTRHVINIVYQAALKAHDAVKKIASCNPEARLKDFATTLMFAICKRYDFGWFIASFWVGDGAICLFDRNTKTARLLGIPDEGEFSGQTRFLTMPEIFHDPDAVSRRLRMAIVPDFTALFLMTDGISDPMFETDRNLNDYAKWEEFFLKLQTGFPGDDIGGVDLSGNNTSAGDQLLGWLDFWSPGNHDDRTIAILY